MRKNLLNMEQELAQTSLAWDPPDSSTSPNPYPMDLKFVPVRKGFTGPQSTLSEKEVESVSPKTFALPKPAFTFSDVDSVKPLEVAPLGSNSFPAFPVPTVTVETSSPGGFKFTSTPSLSPSPSTEPQQFSMSPSAASTSSTPSPSGFAFSFDSASTSSPSSTPFKPTPSSARKGSARKTKSHETDKQFDFDDPFGFNA